MQHEMKSAAENAASAHKAQVEKIRELKEAVRQGKAELAAAVALADSERRTLEDKLLELSNSAQDTIDRELEKQLEAPLLQCSSRREAGSVGNAGSHTHPPPVRRPPPFEFAFRLACSCRNAGRAREAGGARQPSGSPSIGPTGVGQWLGSVAERMGRQPPAATNAQGGGTAAGPSRRCQMPFSLARAVAGCAIASFKGHPGLMSGGRCLVAQGGAICRDRPQAGRPVVTPGLAYSMTPTIIRILLVFKFLWCIREARFFCVSRRRSGVNSNRWRRWGARSSKGN